MTSGGRLAVVPATHLLFVRDSDGSVLLSRRFGTGWEDGKYSVPAGHFDGGETARRASVREAAEEVGVVVDEHDLRFAHVMHRVTPGEAAERIDLFFFVDRWSGEPSVCEPDRCDELRWVDPSDLPENMVEYVRVAITLALADVPYGEVGW